MPMTLPLIRINANADRQQTVRNTTKRDDGRPVTFSKPIRLDKQKAVGMIIAIIISTRKEYGAPVRQ